MFCNDGVKMKYYGLHVSSLDLLKSNLNNRK